MYYFITSLISWWKFLLPPQSFSLYGYSFVEKILWIFFLSSRKSRKNCAKFFWKFYFSIVFFFLLCSIYQFLIGASFTSFFFRHFFFEKFSNFTHSLPVEYILAPIMLIFNDHLISAYYFVIFIYTIFFKYWFCFAFLCLDMRN